MFQSLAAKALAFESEEFDSQELTQVLAPSKRRSFQPTCRLIPLGFEDKRHAQKFASSMTVDYARFSGDSPRDPR